MRNSLRGLPLVVSIIFACPFVGKADENRYLEDIDVGATLKVEPEYQCEKPAYAVIAIGKQLDRFVWCVLDKSDSSSRNYDQLYVDVNCNGDLSDKGELFKFSKTTPTVGLPDVVAADGATLLTKFTFRLRDADLAIGMFTFESGETRFGGGYPIDPQKYMQFGEDKDSAPVVWYKIDEPFEFQRWIDGPLKIGSDTDFKVFLGWKGRGPSTFCSTLGHILPTKEIVLASLEYVDVDGKTKSANFEFGERC